MAKIDQDRLDVIKSLLNYKKYYKKRKQNNIELIDSFSEGYVLQREFENTLDCPYLPSYATFNDSETKLEGYDESSSKLQINLNKRRYKYFDKRFIKTINRKIPYIWKKSKSKKRKRFYDIQDNDLDNIPLLEALHIPKEKEEDNCYLKIKIDKSKRYVSGFIIKDDRRTFRNLAKYMLENNELPFFVNSDYGKDLRPYYLELMIEFYKPFLTKFELKDQIDQDLVKDAIYFQEVFYTFFKSYLSGNKLILGNIKAVGEVLFDSFGNKKLSIIHLFKSINETINPRYLRKIEGLNFTGSDYDKLPLSSSVSALLSSIIYKYSNYDELKKKVEKLNKKNRVCYEKNSIEYI
jgi:hypothetical protein